MMTLTLWSSMLFLVSSISTAFTLENEPQSINARVLPPTHAQASVMTGFVSLEWKVRAGKDGKYRLARNLGM